jgi:NAD(P)-dependent dehydrogenase (short-subunit alcohol dehydrogenase family)
MSPPVIVVFGATGGIGSALCRMLRPSFDLLLCARDEQRLQSLGEELSSPWRATEATNFRDVETAFEVAKEGRAGVYGAANCVGSIVLKPAHLTTEADFDETIALNLKSAFAVLRAAAKHADRQGGAVVLFSSAAASVGLPNHEVIAAAKGGISGLVRSAASTYAGRGLRVNAVSPGLVDTPLATRITGNPSALKASEAMHPLGRIATAQEVARVAAFLLAKEQSFITGQILAVDGGLSTVRSK